MHVYLCVDITFDLFFPSVCSKKSLVSSLDCSYVLLASIGQTLVAFEWDVNEC